MEQGHSTHMLCFLRSIKANDRFVPWEACGNVCEIFFYTIQEQYSRYITMYCFPRAYVVAS